MTVFSLLRTRMRSSPTPWAVSWISRSTCPMDLRAPVGDALAVGGAVAEALGGVVPPVPVQPVSSSATIVAATAVEYLSLVNVPPLVLRTRYGAPEVGVDIVHTWRGDLVIDLLAPDGTAYRLKNSRGWDSADDVKETYTVNASSETANGTWRLRVQDVARYDTGYINSAKLTF